MTCAGDQFDELREGNEVTFAGGGGSKTLLVATGGNRRLDSPILLR